MLPNKAKLEEPLKRRMEEFRLSNGMKEGKKDFKQMHLERGRVKIAVLWVTTKNNVHKDQESLQQNIHLKILQQMI